MALSNRLRQAIDRLGMTAKKFSEITGIPYRTLMDYVSGKRAPGSDALTKMAEIGVDVNALLLGRGGHVFGGEICGKLLDDLDDDKIHKLIERQASIKADEFFSHQYAEGNPPLSSAVVRLVEGYTTTLWDVYFTIKAFSHSNPFLMEENLSSIVSVLGPEVVDEIRRALSIGADTLPPEKDDRDGAQ